ncbi:hypothetical protein [Sporichthya sp.]|uniref:hypothetical protein n=1 Tax=Sporichthya sp. TaxID=65475 RepID=UPI0017FCB6A9|nr:hypothetical protein [Sporichthya sp.]MBA3741830.1 hypothetical protein [Sporichthya sp.]
MADLVRLVGTWVVMAGVLAFWKVMIYRGGSLSEPTEVPFDELEKRYPNGGVGVAGPGMLAEIRSLPMLHKVIVRIMVANIFVAMVLASFTVPYILTRWGYGYVLK